MCSNKSRTVAMVSIGTIDESGSVKPFYNREHVNPLCQMRVINELVVLGGVVWSSSSRDESGRKYGQNVEDDQGLVNSVAHVGELRHLRARQKSKPPSWS